MLLFRFTARLTTPAGSGAEEGASAGASRRLPLPGALSCILDVTGAASPSAGRTGGAPFCCRDLRAEAVLIATTSKTSEAASRLGMTNLIAYQLPRLRYPIAHVSGHIREKDLAPEQCVALFRPAHAEKHC